MTTERMTVDAASALATELADAFPNHRVQDGTIQWWTRSFVRFSPDVVHHVVYLIAANATIPPQPREVARMLEAEALDREPTLEIEPESRWLTAGEMKHGRFHLRRYLMTGEEPDLRDSEEKQRAIAPWDCSCDEWVTEPEQASLI